MSAFNRKTLPFTLAVLAILASSYGCSSIGGIPTHIRANYYLDKADYQGGLEVFSKRTKDHPENGLDHYYTGRFYLALEKPEKAIVHFLRATELQPNRADNYFWLGVTYWALANFEKERESYEKAIRLNRLHVPAHVYLGHSYLDSGQSRAALGEYEVVLKQDPYQPEALYNRAMALRSLGKKNEECSAWKKYLEYYPDGSLARQAVGYLNEEGDFSFRNHLIGIRLVTLEWIRFRPRTNDLHVDSLPSLNVVGSILKVNKKITLEIESYYQGDSDLAKARAIEVKKHILDRYPEVEPERLVLSHYGRAEQIKAGNKMYELGSSIVFKTIKN